MSRGPRGEDWWKNPEREQARDEERPTWGGGIVVSRAEQKVVAETVTQRGRAQERSPVSSVRPVRGLGSHTHPCPLLNPQSTSQAQEHRSPGHLRIEILSLYSPGWSLAEAQPTSFAPRVPFPGPVGAG